nr:immunoglobulin light chain junction region [Macaca mulatta]
CGSYAGGYTFIF